MVPHMLTWPNDNHRFSKTFQKWSSRTLWSLRWTIANAWSLCLQMVMWFNGPTHARRSTRPAKRTIGQYLTQITSRGIAHAQGGLHIPSPVHSSQEGAKSRHHYLEQWCELGDPPTDMGWGGPFWERMGVELLGARYSSRLNRA